MANVWGNLLALLLWPGLASGVILGWFYLWLVRKLTARLQGRRGPFFYQPFFDFVKLLGKQTLLPGGISRVMFYGLPLAALLSTLFALALIPVPGNPITSFAGDLIVLIYLLEMPALIEVLAGYSSRSLYGQVSAAREALLSLGYNLPMLAAVIALAMHVGTFSLRELAAAPPSWVHLLAAAAFLLAIPARLKINPFSIPNAEQEIVAGAHTEFNGVPLALFELGHALELVALLALFAVLFVPPVGSLLAGLGLYLLVSLALVALVALLGAATARVKVNQAFRFYWSWGALAAVVVAALVMMG